MQSRPLFLAPLARSSSSAVGFSFGKDSLVLGLLGLTEAACSDALLYFVPKHTHKTSKAQGSHVAQATQHGCKSDEVAQEADVSAVGQC